MQKISTPLVASILWFMIAWAIDKYALRPVCELCSDLFSIQFEFKFREAAELTTKSVGLLALVVLPLTIYAFVVAPYSKLRSSQAWRVAIQRWCQPIAYLVGAFLLAFVIEYFIYDPIQEHIPAEIKSFIERFWLSVTFILPSIETFKLTTHLGGVLGLAGGLYLFLTRSWTGPTR